MGRPAARVLALSPFWRWCCWCCLLPHCRIQVWEFDKNLLQADALPAVGQYKYEVATIMRGLAMDEFLPAVTQARCSVLRACLYAWPRLP